MAEDEQFRRIRRAGVVLAGPESAHAVHVEVHGLRPGREYYYRFRVQRWESPVGRGVTAPSYGAAVASLAMAFTSCSNFPAGFFTAYRHLAEERPDLILHLGDYQYEGPAGSSTIGRPHIGPETVTLANYRQRQAQYKSDVDLQAAHAAAPWLPVWDDHEVDNNYAGDTPEHAADGPTFLERRAAAYRAYYENMPLRRTSVPSGPGMQLYRRLRWGSLASFHMLDTRQFRDDQSCGDGFDDCPAAADPARSLPGAAQEAWLADGLRTSGATWDVIGQQVFFGRRDNDPGAANTVSMDAWDGYPASRARVAQSWVDAGARNPVVLTGDVHAHWASEIYADPFDPASGIVGSELISSSISLRWRRLRRADRHPSVGGVEPEPQVLDQPARLRVDDDHARRDDRRLPVRPGGHLARVVCLHPALLRPPGRRARADPDRRPAPAGDLPGQPAAERRADHRRHDRPGDVSAPLSTRAGPVTLARH